MMQFKELAELFKEFERERRKSLKSITNRTQSLKFKLVNRHQSELSNLCAMIELGKF